MELRPNNEWGMRFAVAIIVIGFAIGSLAGIEYLATGSLKAPGLVEAALGILSISGGLGALVQSAPESPKVG